MQRGRRRTLPRHVANKRHLIIAVTGTYLFVLALQMLYTTLDWVVQAVTGAARENLQGWLQLCRSRAGMRGTSIDRTFQWHRPADVRHHLAGALPSCSPITLL
jgi:hypothetical protein